VTTERLGTQIGARFRLLSVLGEGGMGTVYLADDIAGGGKAAVKFLRPHLVTNEEFVARFRQESRSASRFRHESAVRVLATGDDNSGVPWIAMEYCGGSTLKEIVAAEAPLEISRACKLAEQILRALTEAHASGIIHRDLKPGNVKVERSEEGELAKILDFGVAKFVGSEDEEEMSGAVKTKTGVVFGTPKYMSPEQILGEPVDSRSDIYSVGAMLYEMLTGTPPFQSDDVIGFVTKHMKEAVEPMAERAPEVAIPAELETITRGMLEKNRVARPARAAEVAESLEPFVKAGAAFGRRILRLRTLGFLAGGIVGGALTALVAPRIAAPGASAAFGLGVGSAVSFLLFPRAGEISFWIRTLIVAATLAATGGLMYLVTGGPGMLVLALGAASMLVFVLFSAGWGNGSRIVGAAMGGLLGPILSVPFLPFPSGDGYVRLWNVPEMDLSTLGPAAAICLIGIAFAGGALVAPDSVRRTRSPTASKA
jgi:hypothetical protein